MAKASTQSDRIVRELAEIKSLLQALLILAGARSGLNRDQVREITGVATKRVSDIWGNIKNKDEK